MTPYEHPRRREHRVRLLRRARDRRGDPAAPVAAAGARRRPGRRRASATASDADADRARAPRAACRPDRDRDRDRRRPRLLGRLVPGQEQAERLHGLRGQGAGDRDRGSRAGQGVRERVHVVDEAVRLREQAAAVRTARAAGLYASAADPSARAAAGDPSEPHRRDRAALQGPDGPGRHAGDVDQEPDGHRSQSWPTRASSSRRATSCGISSTAYRRHSS